MRIVKTTDGLHIGTVLPVLNKGDSIDLNGFTFEVQTKITLENGHTLFSNPNYQLECEE